MEEDRNLISKRELLSRYGISYGALYRWKRKGLIPDDWFIRKSTATGQETYFPETLICERVERILETKNEVLLDELAGKLSGEERQNAFIVIDTPYGEKSFKMNDIRSVTLRGDGGAMIDITETVKQLIPKGRN